ncbi:MAG: hypothetical protein IT376_06220, partial [Polyangiaceae bacterium]|nr:hypothetical protein [Polyangiaceae bacterium]
AVVFIGQLEAVDEALVACDLRVREGGVHQGARPIQRLGCELGALGRRGGVGSWWQTMIFSVLQVGLLISIALSFLPSELLNNFMDITRQIFTSYWGKSAWLILPLIMMALMPKTSRRSDPDED